jgi:hypothetical protein
MGKRIFPVNEVSSRNPHASSTAAGRLAGPGPEGLAECDLRLVPGAFRNLSEAVAPSAEHRRWEVHSAVGCIRHHGLADELAKTVLDRPTCRARASTVQGPARRAWTSLKARPISGPKARATNRWRPAPSIRCAFSPLEGTACPRPDRRQSLHAGLRRCFVNQETWGVPSSRGLPPPCSPLARMGRGSAWSTGSRPSRRNAKNAGDSGSGVVLAPTELRGQRGTSWRSADATLRGWHRPRSRAFRDRCVIEAAMARAGEAHAAL